MQGRCPRLSQRDQQCLQKALSTDGPLSHLPHNARAHIYQTIIQYFHTIPSLYTFFKDLIYIKRCRDLLKKLITDDKYLPKDQSLKKCFYKIFQARQRAVIQTNHRDFQNGAEASQEDRFLLSYSQMWLCAMRYWPDSLTEGGRKLPTAVDQCFQSCLRAQFWALIAKTALDLGFRSSRIVSLASKTEGLDLTSTVSYPGFTDTVNQEHWERWGVPYQDKHLSDRNTLFINRLLVEVPQDSGLSEEISTFFVRRSLFLRLFPQSMESFQRAQSQSDDTLQAENGDHFPNEPVNLLPRDSVSDRVNRLSQPDTVTTLPRNVNPSQEIEMTDTIAGPDTGRYKVEVLELNSRKKIRRQETKVGWLLVLRALQERRFQLYDSTRITALDYSQLSAYEEETVIAAHPSYSYNNVRTAYGLSV